MQLGEILQSIALGTVQGLTEFIPVSSSAHVTLLPQILGWQPSSTTFVLFVHLGTLLALLFYFRSKLFGYLVSITRAVSSKGQSVSKEDRIKLRTIVLIIAAAIPVGIAGILLEERIEDFYDNTATPTLANLVTLAALAGVGVIFLFNDRLFNSKRKPIEKLSFLQAALIGLSQALAFVRGISRSGITLLSAQLMGLNRVSAAEFSFLISIPVLIGTSTIGIMQAVNNTSSTASQELFLAIAGMISAGVSGYLAIRFMLKYLANNSLRAFGIYRIVVAIVLAIILFGNA